MSKSYTNIIRDFIFLVAFFCQLQSCQKEDDVTLSFIGDSIIEVWDTQQYFPYYYTKNYGISSTGIEYINECSGKFKGHNLVVLTGGNDVTGLLKWMDISTPTQKEEVFDDYVNYYIKAISNLQASRVYLFSILPRGNNVEFDDEIRNRLAVRLNAVIKQRAQEKGWIYIDAYTPFLKDNRLNPQFSRDGMHPNKHGYDLLTQLLKENL